MNKGFMIYLNDETHKKAKKRAVDLDISLSKHISWLIRKDLQHAQNAKASLEIVTK